jgi:hypothetical protein
MELRQRPGKVFSLSAIRSSRHFEGANITASSSEQFRLTGIQTGQSKCLFPPSSRPRKCRRSGRRRGIAPKTSGRRGPELRGFRGAGPFAREGMGGRRLINSSPALSAALRASAGSGSGSEPDLPALAAAERPALPQDPRFNKKRSTRIVSRARSAALRMSMTRTREVIRAPLGRGGRRRRKAPQVRRRRCRSCHRPARSCVRRRGRSARAPRFPAPPDG